MAANKSDGHAVRAFGELNYEAMPKSVLALIAYSFAERIAAEGNRDAVMAEIVSEWGVLHAGGIVPQKPKKLETMSQEADRIETHGIKSDWNRQRVALLRSMTEV